ncbi:MAG: Gfo/Idh/MocA family protein [Aureliella sp.]
MKSYPLVDVLDSRILKRDRRLFLKAGLSMAACASSSTFGQDVEQAAGSQLEDESNSAPKLRVGVMGLNGRGGALTRLLTSSPRAQVTHLCDVDSRVLESAGRTVASLQGEAARSFADIREMLHEDFDALFVAAPNHWHAPAAIMACRAGKHVYVEKPCSHNPAEGVWAVEAARKFDRVVQTGTQRRSWPVLQEAITKLHSGEIGDILYARCWYNNRRPSIGKESPSAAPSRLDWDLWQGPAARVAFQENFAPYNWHWFWRWGNGELGNNGVHGIDLARWGMQLQYPERVIASGGKYRHEDDQETPDTLSVAYEYASKQSITWQGLSWSPIGEHDVSFGVSFHGTEGTMVMRSAGYTIFDMKRNETLAKDGRPNDSLHLENFFDCIASGERPAADIQIGHDSALLCHYGNIAYQEQKALEIDTSTGRILTPIPEVRWEREYAPGWHPELD